jgi:hypothetical protein
MAAAAALSRPEAICQARIASMFQRADLPVLGQSRRFGFRLADGSGSP